METQLSGTAARVVKILDMVPLSDSCPEYWFNNVVYMCE